MWKVSKVLKVHFLGAFLTRKVHRLWQRQKQTEERQNKGKSLFNRECGRGKESETKREQQNKER